MTGRSTTGPQRTGPRPRSSTMRSWICLRSEIIQIFETGSIFKDDLKKKYSISWFFMLNLVIITFISKHYTYKVKQAQLFKLFFKNLCFQIWIYSLLSVHYLEQRVVYLEKEHMYQADSLCFQAHAKNTNREQRLSLPDLQTYNIQLLFPLMLTVYKAELQL